MWNCLDRAMPWKCGRRLIRNKRLVFVILVGLNLLLLLRGYGSLWNSPSILPNIVQRFGVSFTERHLQQPFITSPVIVREGTGVSDQKCVHPTLSPYDPAVMQYHEYVKPVDCKSAMKNWVYVSNGTFHIDRDAIQLHGDITCTYVPVVRKGDFIVKDGPRVKPMLDGTPLKSDFFTATCVSDKGTTYSNVHAAVARNADVMNRLHNYNSDASYKDPGNSRQSSHGLNLSVFMFGFDSLSHMAWLRHLPKTRRYFVDTLGGIELDGYNIRGDGTPAALLPILTGKTEAELPEARRGFSGAKPVDNHPWIWNDFSKRGYVTAYSEDMAQVGTFHFRMLGFREKPTDHFMRPFYLAERRTGNKNPRFCLGSTPRHVVFMDWYRDLFDMYKNFPKFFFGFHGEMSHDNNNLVQAVDDDLVAFLQDLETKGHLNSTLLILMTDHGARYDHIRATAQGKLEERMPYFSLRFPPWFRKLHPDIIRNVRINTKRLTTPFDIHATFHDILNYSSTIDGDVRNRAISLFKQIPKQRTCTDAGIFPHWCACLEWHTVNQSDPLVSQAVKAAIRAINSYTEANRKLCAKLTLLHITNSVRYQPNSGDLSAEWKEFNFNHIRRPSSDELYQVSFKTLPGEGHFEVTCKLDAKSRAFSVDATDISRINKYGSQPACIEKSLPHLRQYCYCV